MAGEAAPAGADLDDVVVGAEAELGAQPVELCPLGVGQATSGLGKTADEYIIVSSSMSAKKSFDRS